jgi:hypothetical protein
MLESEIDYEALINRSITDFRPVKRSWPIGVRLVLWIFLDLILLTLCAGVNGFQGIATLIQSSGTLIKVGAFTLASVGAGFLALRSAIPAREPTRFELLILTAGLCAAFVATVFQPLAAPSQTLSADLHWVLQMVGLSILPWMALFWAVERGVPLQAFETGGLIGVASFCFGIAAQSVIPQTNAVTSPLVLQIGFGIVVAMGSAFAGAHWLNPVKRWQRDSGLSGGQATAGVFFSRQTVVPLVTGASVITLLLVLSHARETFTPIPDFDLAIEKYERSVTNFSPNVPSRNIETMLTAYVENGMPPYMWDFSPQGFRFVGGRFEHLSDGTPVTYTWFHGAKGGVMCMFRQIDGFKAPSAVHEERHHLLFYRYRGFSVCLVNVGEYGSFLSVVVARMPMNKFMPLMFAATL